MGGSACCHGSEALHSNSLYLEGEVVQCLCELHKLSGKSPPFGVEGKAPDLALTRRLLRVNYRCSLSG